MKVNNRKGRKRALPENSTTEHAEAEDLPVADIEKDTVEQLPKDQEHVTDKRRRIKKKKNKSNAPAVEKVEFDSVEGTAFKDFDLDEIILKGVGELGWERPTQVQESVIPLAIEEKNLMVRARTGSGKTAAFVLPILHKVMQYTSSTTNPPPGPYAIFIAPTKELSSQIYKLLVTLCKPFPYLRNLNLTEVDEKESAVWEKDQPELVVTTPLKMQVMLKMRPNFCTSVRHVVIDEADLLLSFGYEAEMRCIRSHLPPIYQCILTSATLTDDMSSLKALFMTGPVLTIKLKEGDLPDASQLVQYYLHVTDDEQRFAILLAMLKLRLIVGRSIIFVKNPERCYKMNLFLWAFKLKSCILNSAMPANSRCHVINQFNEGLFPIIVASDSSHLFGADNNSDQDKKKRKRLDKEAGVSRGIDFHHVSNVVNFDFPTSIESYIHRVGRTARGFNKGTALSFCTPIEKGLLMNTQKTLQEHVGRKVLQPYDIRVKELDSFVLRTQDALSKCTPHVIREMRLAEIREEALRSAKLQAYFAANPREKELLQTDKKLRKLDMVNSAIFDVPEYIVPVALRGPDYSEETRQQKRNKKRNRAGRMTLHQRRAARDAKDPLRSFSA